MTDDHRLASVSSASADWTRTKAFDEAAAECMRAAEASTFADTVSEDERNGHRSACNLLAMNFRVMASRAAPEWFTPEPVPATNQAGEVDAVATAKARLSIAAVKARNRGAERGAVEVIADDVAVLLAAHSDLDRQLSALATQPATSQEGEAREPMAHLGVLYTVAGVMAEMLAVGTADDEGDLAEDWPLDCRADVNRWQAVIRNALAATPTPPTLSEDLREEPIAAFGAVMFNHIWESFTDDRWDIEINDLVTVDAVKAGLVSVAPYDPEVHNDQSGAAEVGDDFYEITPAGRAALARAQVKAS